MIVNSHVPRRVWGMNRLVKRDGEKSIKWNCKLQISPDDCFYICNNCEKLQLLMMNCGSVSIEIVTNDIVFLISVRVILTCTWGCRVCRRYFFDGIKNGVVNQLGWTGPVVLERVRGKDHRLKLDKVVANPKVEFIDDGIVYHVWCLGETSEGA